MRSRSFKVSLSFIAVVIAYMNIGVSSLAAEGATDTYNYSFWGDTVVSPAAYTPTQMITGKQIAEVGSFLEPSDMHVTDDQHVYITDSGHNRIVVFNEQFEFVKSIDHFINEGKEDTFNKPQGIFVNDNKHIYIADTGNKRVVQLDENLQLVQIVSSPQSELLHDNFNFLPTRVIVDKALRIYVMSTGVFDGFMEFTADGEFTTFIGANRVSVDPVEYIWKLLSTKEQRSQMVQFVPTEFTNLDINDEGFIYATNGDAWGDTIKKLNAQGTDILRREGYFNPGGDIRYRAADGPSRLVDIEVWHSEIYSVLDSKRGRIFTYNSDGYLMYVFGGLGNLKGEFVTPVAIERIGDRFLVLDRALAEITVFETTDYGRTINEAVRAYYNGNEQRAHELYQQAINQNANLDFAYTGIGKALFRQGKYKEAMSYFRESKDQKSYSKAFLLYRKEVMREYFPYMMTGIVLLILTFIIVRRTVKYKRKKGGNHVVTMD